MKKLLFGITSLTFGGAERVLVDVVNKLNNEYDITIFTLYANGEFEKTLSSNVKIVSLYSKSYNEMTRLQKNAISIKLLFCRKRIYNKFVKSGEFDTEIAFLEGPITRLFATKNKGTKKIAWVHNDISQVFGNGIKAKVKRIYDKLIYSKYDDIVFVSEDNLDKFRKLYPSISENKLKLVYNYIDCDNVLLKSNNTLDIEFCKEKINFITVARLTKQKAIDRLIKVHAKLVNDGVEHRIYVIGDGPEKESLEKAIKDNGISNSFCLLGKKENPYPYIKNADVFCLLSRYEGYGMVLEEAKILDKFIIITNTAAREAVQNYEASIILENNDEAIYNGLKDVIQNKDKYKAKIDTKEKYDNSNLLEKIRNIL